MEKGTVSSEYSNKKRGENITCSGVFLMKFEVLGYVVVKN